MMMLMLSLPSLSLDVGLEMRKVVDSTLAVGSCNNVFGVLANILGDLSPSSLNGCNGVGEGAVLFADDDISTGSDKTHR